MRAVAPNAGGRRQRSGGPQWPGDLPLPAQVLGPGDLLSADELPDGLVVADECGRVVIFNRAAERLTGIGADQALGRDLVAALPLPAPDRLCSSRPPRPYPPLPLR